MDWFNKYPAQDFIMCSNTLLRNNKSSVILAFVRNKKARKELDKYKKNFLDKNIVFKVIHRREGVFSWFKEPIESIYLIAFNQYHEHYSNELIHDINQLLAVFEQYGVSFTYLKMCGSDGLLSIIKTSEFTVTQSEAATISTLEFLIRDL